MKKMKQEIAKNPMEELKGSLDGARVVIRAKESRARNPAISGRNWDGRSSLAPNSKVMEKTWETEWADLLPDEESFCRIVEPMNSH